MYRPELHPYPALLSLALASCIGIAAVPATSAATHVPRYARNFQITSFPTHRIATIHTAPQDSTITHQYALVPRHQALPELPDNVTVIRTPVERVVVMETVYIGYLDALGQSETIVGAASVDYISHPTIRSRLEQGRIQAVQIGAALDLERLLLLRPDLILTSIAAPPPFDVPATLERSGLPIVRSAGYMESHPLARSEWIKFIAAFFELEDQAHQYFDTVAARYQALCRKTQSLQQRPSVFCGAPYAGAWHVASGESYTAQTIRDAGGHYLWADSPGSGAIPLDTERVFGKAANANIWINPGHYRSRSALYGADQRFRKFRAAHTGQIFNNTRQRNPSGGNSIWETGIVRPDDVLADLIKIFHPELMPDWEFVYYERLP